MFSWFKKIKLQSWLLFFIVFGNLYDIFLSPIVNINIERWAESKDIDNELVDGGQQVMQAWISFLEWIDWALEFLTNPYFVGFGIGFVGLGIFQKLTNVYGRPAKDNLEAVLHKADIGSKKAAAKPVVPRAGKEIASFKGSMLEGVDPEKYEISDRNDFDLIPLDLVVRCKRNDDGFDIKGIMQFRNRGTKPIHLGSIAQKFSLDGKFARAAGISTPLGFESSQSANFQSLRVYDEKDHGGYGLLILKFGLSKETIRCVMAVQYDFKILSYPQNKSIDLVCELEVDKKVQYLIERKT